MYLFLSPSPFTFSFLLNFCNMLIYLYPVDSENYKETDFGILAKEKSFWNNMGYTIYGGGYFNARLGDLKSSRETYFTGNMTKMLILL